MRFTKQIQEFFWIIAIVASVSGFDSQAIAQLQNCAGVWSNKPCDKVSTDRVSQYKSTQDDSLGYSLDAASGSEDDPNLSKKQSLVHRLFKEASEARRKYGIQTDLSLVRSICLERPTDLQTCNRAISEESDRLHERVHQVEELALKKKELELKEKKQEQENTTNVIVDNRTQIYNIRRPHHPRDPRREPSHSGASVEIRVGN